MFCVARKFDVAGNLGGLVVLVFHAIKPEVAARNILAGNFVAAVENRFEDALLLRDTDAFDEEYRDASFIAHIGADPGLSLHILLECSDNEERLEAMLGLLFAVCLREQERVEVEMNFTANMWEAACFLMRNMVTSARDMEYTNPKVTDRCQALGFSDWMHLLQMSCCKRSHLQLTTFVDAEMKNPLRILLLPVRSDLRAQTVADHLQARMEASPDVMESRLRAGWMVEQLRIETYEACTLREMEGMHVEHWRQVRVIPEEACEDLLRASTAEELYNLLSVYLP